MPTVPKNQNIRCNARSIVRYPKDYKDKRLQAQPILDRDGRKQYKPCESWAVHGATVCSVHGGNAPQVITAAKRALALATQNVAEMLEDIALDARMPAEVRIKAGIQILDRAGIRGGIDLGLETPKWQGILGAMFGAPEVESEPEEAPEVVEPVRKQPAKKAAPRKASAKPAAKPKFEGW